MKILQRKNWNIEDISKTLRSRISAITRFHLKTDWCKNFKWLNDNPATKYNTDEGNGM